MPLQNTRKIMLAKPVEEINRATYEKLLRLMLMIAGGVIGWMLCYYFPVLGHYTQYAGQLK